MDLLIILGWADEAALKAINDLGLMPQEVLEMNEDEAREFLVSDKGEIALQDQISNFNKKHNTTMRWIVIESPEGNDYLLAWTTIINYQYDDPHDNPVAGFAVAFNDIKKFMSAFKKLIKSEYLECDVPDMQIISDSTVFYNTIIDSHKCYHRDSSD